MAIKITERTPSKKDYTLRQAMTIDQLHELMQERWSEDKPGKFKLKKGLFGKSIQFDVYRQVMPRITVKGNVVMLRKISNSTEVSVGGSPSLDFKNARHLGKDFKEGGMKKALNAGADYFVDVMNALQEVLGDRLA